MAPPADPASAAARDDAYAAGNADDATAAGGRSGALAAQGRTGNAPMPRGGEAAEQDAASEEEEEDSDEDDEEEDEDPAQTIANLGRHARMQRIQKVLFEQLVGNDERLSLELREKEEEMKRVKQQREDMGVALYGVQQQLAQLQLALESAHRKLNATHDARFHAEDALDEGKDGLQQKKLTVEQHRTRLHKTQSELDALNATLRQVEKYSDEMKSEIARTQRAAQKAEEVMTGMEKDKVQQDLYIDTLNEQIRALHDKLTTSAAQLKQQRLETQAAEETLREATTQMESIAFEKKQLVQQWKSALVGLQQRDEALRATQTAISSLSEEELSLATELRGYKHSIEQAQTEHETRTATLERFASEIRFVEQQIEQLMQEHEHLSERYEMLTKSFQQTDAQRGKVETEAKRLDADTTQIAQFVETTQRERHALEDQISAQKNSQTTANKAANNLTKEAAKVQSVIHDKELALANLRNEMARVAVDTLNVQTHLAQLGETHEQLVADLQRDDLQVEKMELEMRQRNDEIEKKMLRLDRLNKKYEQLVARLEDENTGPLEATIKNLSRETAAVRTSNLEHQNAWLQAQTALVALSIDAQELSERNQGLKSKTSVLEQKHLRLQNDLDKLEQDSHELQTRIHALHADTGKLNELIARHSTRHDELLDRNHALEIDFQRELQELEAEAVQLEQRAVQLKTDKQEILDRIVEVERQVMLWEKKIQLEKETQAALDPEVGQAEARAMEKEIHRMRLRLEALQRSQEEMLQAMEQAILKRDLIAMRGRSKKDAEVTCASLTAKVSTLENNMKKAAKETSELDRQVKHKLVLCEDMAFQVEKAAAELKAHEERGATLQKAINNALYEKQRYMDAEARRLRLSKRLEGLKKSSSGAAMTPEDEAKLQQEEARAQSAVDKVRGIIAQLQQQSPHLAEVLTRVAMLSDEPTL